MVISKKIYKSLSVIDTKYKEGRIEICHYEKSSNQGEDSKRGRMKQGIIKVIKC